VDSTADEVEGPVAAILDRLTELVRDARSMPMSASCVVNRSEVLGLLDDLRHALPESFGRASRVLSERDGVVAEGRSQALRLLEQARAERKQILAETEVHKAADAEARRIVEEARAQAEAVRVEAEEYVDAKLANFEVVLAKTLGAVQRGRARLHGESELDTLGDDQDAPDGPSPLPRESHA
jgi:cell division septum initiation protein DivIVA